jgi:hypothetical protein
MTESAQVHSLELLRRLHDVLARFRVDAQAALATGTAEIRRTHDTLVDRLKYWQQQVNKRQEERNEARASLAHARALAKGKTTGCVEQELALRKAEQRLKDAEEKVITVRRWQRQLPEVVKEFEGPARSLSGFLESDLRQAIVLLENKLATLESYLAIVSSDEARRSYGPDGTPSAEATGLAPTPTEAKEPT